MLQPQGRNIHQGDDLNKKTVKRMDMTKHGKGICKKKQRGREGN